MKQVFRFRCTNVKYNHFCDKITKPHSYEKTNVYLLELRLFRIARFLCNIINRDESGLQSEQGQYFLEHF